MNSEMVRGHIYGGMAMSAEFELPEVVVAPVPVGNSSVETTCADVEYNLPPPPSP